MDTMGPRFGHGGISPMHPSATAAHGARLWWCQNTSGSLTHLSPGHTHHVLQMPVKILSSPSLMPEFMAEERISLLSKPCWWNTSKLLAFTST